MIISKNSEGWEYTVERKFLEENGIGLSERKKECDEVSQALEEIAKWVYWNGEYGRIAKRLAIFIKNSGPKGVMKFDAMLYKLMKENFGVTTEFDEIPSVYSKLIDEQVIKLPKS